jgi:hypothetical protein
LRERAKFGWLSLRWMMWGLGRLKFGRAKLRGAELLGAGALGRAKLRGACGAGRAKFLGACGAGRAKAGAAGRGAAARGGGAAGRGGGAARAAGALPFFAGGSALATLALHIATIDTNATVRTNADMTASWANGEPEHGSPI